MIFTLWILQCYSVLYTEYYRMKTAVFVSKQFQYNSHYGIMWRIRRINYMKTDVKSHSQMFCLLEFIRINEANVIITRKKNNKNRVRLANILLPIRYAIISLHNHYSILYSSIYYFLFSFFFSSSSSFFIHADYRNKFILIKNVCLRFRLEWTMNSSIWFDSVSEIEEKFKWINNILKTSFFQIDLTIQKMR